MEKILVFKGRPDWEKTLIPVDELCHGLLSRARYDEFFMPKKGAENGDPKGLIVVRPSRAEFKMALLWFDAGPFPVEACADFLKGEPELLWAGEFTPSEIKKFKTYSSAFEAWKAE